jgi:hypothetical protein
MSTGRTVRGRNVPMSPRLPLMSPRDKVLNGSIKCPWIRVSALCFFEFCCPVHASAGELRSTHTLSLTRLQRSPSKLSSDIMQYDAIAAISGENSCAANSTCPLRRAERCEGIRIHAQRNKMYLFFNGVFPPWILQYSQHKWQNALCWQRDAPELLMTLLLIVLVATTMHALPSASKAAAQS